ncbi:amidohydrolase family protein [Qipengyuania sp.]|uniref:metal-dependent hydrolase family protein n=1 Tax=Qipengyuania sp. TaxID=2004515 RepID=UPI0035C7AEC2
MRALTLPCAVLAAAIATVPAAGQETEAAPETVYIHAGHLLADPAGEPRGASTIVVRGDTISEVRDGFAPPPSGARLVDLSQDWVMPGLIDMHVHLLGIGGDPLRARLSALTSDEADDLLIGVGNARDTLMAGFTTVRDLGASARPIRALRDAIARGDVTGPTIVNAGEPISVTGGHGDPTNGLAETFADAVHAHVVNTCDGPDDCRRAVRQQVALGAQVIKFMATGGVLSNVAGGLGRAMTPDEMRAVVETAHELGRKTAAHSHAAAGTRAAVEAGVDSIEHGTFMDDETLALIKRKGTWLVPTMLAVNTVTHQAEDGALPPNVVPKVREAAAAANQSYRMMVSSGAKMAFGTDTGVSKHGENAKEFALMVQAGMTPARAIRAATVDAAEALGRSDRGRIAAGMVADIVAVDSDPLSDVRELEDVDFVMKGGHIVRED